jgi:hypothetical protein
MHSVDSRELWTGEVHATSAWPRSAAGAALGGHKAARGMDDGRTVFLVEFAVDASYGGCVLGPMGQWC